MSVKQLCFSFKGRISRSTFWLYAFFAACFRLLMGGLVIANEALMPICVLFLLLLFYTDTAVCVKRFHDRNKSGLTLLWFIPLIGLAIIIPIIPGLIIALWVIIELGCCKGTNGPNRFGADPKALNAKEDPAKE